jgi:hypothetical protein
MEWVFAVHEIHTKEAVKGRHTIASNEDTSC